MQYFLDGWISCSRCDEIRVECDDKRPQRSDCHELHQLEDGTAESERRGVRVLVRILQL